MYDSRMDRQVVQRLTSIALALVLADGLMMFDACQMRGSRADYTGWYDGYPDLIGLKSPCI